MRCASALAALVLFHLPGLATQGQPGSEIGRAVEEFKVQTRALGLRADSPRKRGKRNGRSASWHGRVFWNFRNDFLDAVPHEVTQTGGDKGILRRNQYGFNISGPVVIPKLFHGGSTTFFSLSYEGMREKIGRSRLETVPTTPERLGDFGQVVDKAGDLLPIYDPQSTRLNPAYDPDQQISTGNLQYLREPFPGNRIPSDRLDPVARGAVDSYPQPNVAIGPFFQNNYSIYSPETNKADGMRAKLDHTVTDRNRLSFGLSFSNGFDGPAKLFPTIANPGSSDREFRSRNGSVEHVYTASPNTVNTFRVSVWTSTSENKADVGDEGRPFAVYSFSPYVSMGKAFPVSRTGRTQYSLSNGLATRHGKHSFRISGEWDSESVNSFWPRYPSGRFEFSEALTSLPGINNTGHAFSSFLLGMAKFAESSFVEHPSYFRRKRGELGLRDEWELRQGLTVYLGVSLDISASRVEKYNRQSTVDFTAQNPASEHPGAVIFAGRDGQGRTFQPTHFRVGPWMSISWSPFSDAKTVLRGSFRRFHRSIPVYAGQWGTQGFNGTPTYITENAQLQPAVTLSDGMPEPERPLPDLRPDVANDTRAHLMDTSNRLPTYHSASFSMERQFPGSMVVSVGANHSRGKNMLASNDGANPNAISLDALRYRDELNEEAFNRSLRPYPQYQRFDIYSSYPVGKYARNEGYIRLEKRTSKGLSLRAVYEFAKQMDDYSSRQGLQDYYHREKEWAMNPYNDPHRLSLSYMYELPFGPGQQFLKAADWKRYVIEGWMVSGATSYSAGDPISLRAAFNNTGNVVDDLYVNAVPGVDAHVPNQGPERWFNPDAFINPPDFSIGNLSRTHPSLRNPSRQNHDVSVTKRVSIASDRALELVGTAFNFLNQADWNRPDAEIGSVEDPNVNAGRIIGSRGGRVVQLGLRITF